MTSDCWPHAIRHGRLERTNVKIRRAQVLGFAACVALPALPADSLLGIALNIALVLAASSTAPS